jgi:hypothetical protein
MSLISEELESTKAVCKELHTTLEKLQVVQEELAAARCTRSNANATRSYLSSHQTATSDGRRSRQKQTRRRRALLKVKQQVMVGLPLVMFVAEQGHEAFEQELKRSRQSRHQGLGTQANAAGCRGNRGGVKCSCSPATKQAKQ